MKISSLSVNANCKTVFKKTAKVTHERNSAIPVWAEPTRLDDLQIDTVKRALSELQKIEFDNNDFLYIKSLGANPPFKSGADAYRYILENNVSIQYAKFSNPNIHACLSYEENKNGETSILINSNYQNSSSFADVLAISEAIIHEVGHAKDKDNKNSIQEEINCLSLNVLAHRFYKEKYKDIFKNQNSFLFKEGVNLYEKLFFEFNKTSLKKRICEKYGYLQVFDAKHPGTKFAEEIKKEYEQM